MYITNIEVGKKNKPPMIMSFYKKFCGQEKGRITLSQCKITKDPMWHSRFL